MLVEQNSTQGFTILLVDATDKTTGVDGLAATITSHLSKNDGAEQVVSPAITPLGNGKYWIAPIAAHRDTIGVNSWRFDGGASVDMYDVSEQVGDYRPNIYLGSTPIA